VNFQTVVAFLALAALVAPRLVRFVAAHASDDLLRQQVSALDRHGTSGIAVVAHLAAHSHKPIRETTATKYGMVNLGLIT
jgi:hypothetical protein